MISKKWIRIGAIAIAALSLAVPAGEAKQRQLRAKKVTASDCAAQLQRDKDFIRDWVIPTYGEGSWQHREFVRKANESYNRCMKDANAAILPGPNRGLPQIGPQKIK